MPATTSISPLTTTPPATPTSAATPASGRTDGFRDALQQASAKPSENREKPAANESASTEPSTATDEASSACANVPEAGAEPQAGDVAVDDGDNLDPAANGDPAGGSVVPPWLPLVVQSEAPVVPTTDAPAPGTMTAKMTTSETAVPAAMPSMVLQAMRQAPTARTGDAPAADTVAASTPSPGSLPASLAPSMAKSEAKAGATTTTPTAAPVSFDQALQAVAATSNGADSAPQPHSMLAMRNDLPAELTRMTGSATGPAPQALPLRSEIAHTAVPVPVSHPAWSEAFASRIAMQVRDGFQQVSLALNPSELGPVEVRLSVSDGQVSAQFHSAHSHVRQAIEDAMPKLREMLSQSGLSLADSSVSQQAPQRRDGAFGNGGRATGSEDERLADGERTVATSVPSRTIGLIDAYV